MWFIPIIFANNFDPDQARLTSMAVLVSHHRRETTGTSSDSCQLRSFHKRDFYRREFAPEGSQIFTL